MATVYGVLEVELRPDADRDEFERLCRDEVLAPDGPDGLHVHLLHADRGTREGRYAWLVVINSPEVRDSYFPAHGEASEPMMRWFEQHPGALRVMQTSDLVETTHSTDYLDISG